MRTWRNLAFGLLASLSLMLLVNAGAVQASACDIVDGWGTSYVLISCPSPEDCSAGEAMCDDYCANEYGGPVQYAFCTGDPEGGVWVECQCEPLVVE